MRIAQNFIFQSRQRYYQARQCLSVIRQKIFQATSTRATIVHASPVSLLVHLHAGCSFPGLPTITYVSLTLKYIFKLSFPVSGKPFDRPDHCCCCCCCARIELYMRSGISRPCFLTASPSFFVFPSVHYLLTVLFRGLSRIWM